MGSRSLAVLLSGAILSGCVMVGPPAPGSSPALAPAGMPFAFSYACPPGETTRHAGICIGRIDDAAEGYFEVDVAIHPGNANVRAIGVNVVDTPDQLEANPPSLSLRGRYSMAFFFTEDAGVTWRRERLPYVAMPGGPSPQVQVGIAYDPRLAFDAQGVLHVSALLSAGGRSLEGTGVIYASTANLGRTWSDAVALATEGGQNYITLDGAGPVFVSWSTPEDGSEVAWSEDGGATWSGQRPDQVARRCETASNVALDRGTPLLACAGLSGDGALSGLRVYELDVGTGDLALRGELPDVPCRYPRIVAGQGGLLAIAGDECRDDFELRVSRSADGGLTWHGTTVIGENATFEANSIGDFDRDPRGLLHLLAAPGANGNSNADRIHVVLDPVDLGILHEARVSTASAAPVPALEDALPRNPDHYWGLAFDASEGFLAWSRGGGVDYTRLLVVTQPAR